MGYDLHITRARSWLASAGSPILVAEWVDAARLDPRLTEADPQELSDGSGNPAFLLGDELANGPARYWNDGRIVLRGADEHHVPALAEVAGAVDATLVGDDDEVYGP